MNLKNNRPLPKRIIAEGTYLSTCTLCRHGIYKGHDYKWTGIGLIHVGCAKNES